MGSILQRILGAVLSDRALLNQILQRLDAQDKAIAAISAQAQDIIDILTPGPAVGFLFTVTKEDGTEETATMATIRDDQNLPVTISPVDKKGKPAQLDGVPAWASSDETVCTVAPASDGLSAVISGVAPGSARVAVTGDADMGAGVTNITGTLDVTVTAGGATSITINEGSPVDQ